MQESLLNTIKNAPEQKVNVEELEIILDSSLEEVVKLCKKAYLKPKIDDMGNAYFTSEDVNMLKKMKMLYSQSQDIQNKTTGNNTQGNALDGVKNDKNPLNNPNAKVNFLTKAKNRIKESSAVYGTAMPSSLSSYQMKTAMDRLETSLIAKMSEILSEKMDGFDEIIVELIRSKTENETLRQQVNTLNKQVYILKKELATYTPVALNIYLKKDPD